MVNCIVLYLNLYSASRSAPQSEALQYERPREKTEAFRQRKEALGPPPVNKQERVKGGSWFNSAGPMKAKVRVLAIAVPARGTKRSCRFNERSGRREVADAGSRIRSHKYLGARPVCDR